MTGFREPGNVIPKTYVMNNENSHNKKLLIAALDDDPVIRKYISMALSGENELLMATNIQEFRDMAENARPDIFLLDVNLPDGDGIDLCMELRSDPRFLDSFIIILTSQTDSGKIERAYSSGADEFMRKPFLHFELVSKVRIMGRIIEVRENLKRALQSQLDQNVQLFRLSDYIKRSLSFHDTDSILRSAGVLADIIDIDYIEVVKVRNGIPLSIFQKSTSVKNDYITFRDIMKMEHVFNNLKNEIRYFHFRKGGRGLYNCIFSVKCNNAVYGYVILQKNENFSGNEREVISLSLDYMNLLNDTISIHTELRQKNDQYRKEIEMIRKLEVSRLPDLRSVKGYDIGFSFMPAQDLSGDFFDGMLLDDDTYQIVLCDVSGHGIASSYVGTQIRTIIREKSSPDKKPSDIVRDANRELFAGLKDTRFYCTAQIVHLDYDSDNILFISAGHPEAVLYRKATGSFSVLSSRNPVIGMFRDETYRDDIIRLESGDFLFLYTDGLVEEHDADMQGMFGLERLRESLLRATDLGATEIIHHCLGDLYEFNGYRPQNDDITLICIRKN